MNRSIGASVFTASLFAASFAFAQAAAPAAPPAANQPAQTTVSPANAPKADATPNQQKIADLIKQLGADDFPTRDAASNELLKIGQEALPALKEALKSDDASIQSYAEYLVPRIEGARDGRDGRRLANRRNIGGQQFGIVNARPMPADVLVARGARMAINVTANNNGRTANIVDGDRTVVITEGADGIRISVTDNDNGKPVQKDYEAKSIEDLRKDQPEAAQIYDKYMNRGRGLAIGGNARILRLTPPMIDDNGLNNDVRRQLDEAQKLQDLAV